MHKTKGPAGAVSKKPSKSPSQRAKMARNKGASAEREAAALLREWVAPVYEQMLVDLPTIERNLNQSRNGGMDLLGLEWLAPEVKRHETPQLPAWWRQTLNQTRPGQVPLLIWRQNRSPWKFRTRATIWVGPTKHDAVIDLDAHEAQRWLVAQVTVRLLGAKRGLLNEWGLADHLNRATV